MTPTCESLAHFYNAHSKFSHINLKLLKRDQAHIQVPIDLWRILSLQLFSSYFKAELAFTIIHHKFCLFHSGVVVTISVLQTIPYKAALIWEMQMLVITTWFSSLIGTVGMPVIFNPFHTFDHCAICSKTCCSSPLLLTNRNEWNLK